MTSDRLIAGNWKMNGLLASKTEVESLIAGLKAQPSKAGVVLCPPATLLAPFAALVRGTAVALGGQDCHFENSGAFTGDVSAPMLKDAGAAYVILGHSERRTLHKETSELVAKKLAAAQGAGLKVILCVGETLDERGAGRAEAVVHSQLETSIPDGTDAGALVVAYEPVWAIGTGRVASPEDIAAMHGFARSWLDRRFAGARVGVLYGGSVKPDNARETLGVANVDGALVGGASLKAADFLKIIAAA